LSSFSLAPYAFLTFLIGFLAAPLRRLLGPDTAFRVTVAGVALFRLAEQISTDPEVDLWLSIGGMAAFLLFLPIYLAQLRSASTRPAQLWGYGIVLGLAFDIALHRASGTLDLSWISGLVPIVISGAISVLALWSAWAVQQEDGHSETSWSKSIPLIAIGPWLLLQLLIFQSHGWVEEIAGIGPPLGFFVVMLGNVLLVLGVGRGLRRPGQNRSLLAIGAGLYLGLATFTADRPGLLFVVTLLLAQFVMGWGWGLISSKAASASSNGLGRTGIALPLGTLLFLVFAFAYYVGLDIALPFPRSFVPPLGALLFGAMVWMASPGQTVVSEERTSFPVYTAVGLAIVPWILWLVEGPAPEPRPVAGATVRVMTYNIHSGFGSFGRHDPELIAQEIEASGADIVALQEVSRVRLLDGGTDLAVWLSRRLDMPVLFQGTEEPIWGNAILSRYPVAASGWGELPREGALIGRGYIWAEIDLGFPLLLINAHLHHIEEDNHIRLKEVPVLLDFWASRPTTVLLGDLNAEPHYPEMALPAEAGLIDSWGENHSSDGFTWSAANPHKRIDWIWHSTDLDASQVEVIQSPASDHLPVIAEITLAP
jgi:endonuclease/exonuclease/phosphatase family metal-dependent hydrolase